MISQTLDYKYEIYDHIKKLAYNRNASSVGETKAINYIKDELDKAEMDAYIEHFNFTGARRIVMRIFYTLFICYLLIFRLFLVIITYYIIKNLFATTRRLTLIKKEESKNVYTLIPAQEKSKDSRLIIFVAHYDSFTSLIPYRLQKVLFFIFRVIIMPYLGFLVFISFLLIVDIINYKPFSDSVFSLLIISTIIQFFIISIIVLLVYEIEKASGSVDNASGVSILLELVKKIQPNPLKNYDVLFLWSGAEEWGNKGAKSFYHNHKKNILKKYDMDHSYCINIDMVGSYIGLVDKYGLFKRKQLNTSLNDLLEESANELDIPIERYSPTIEPRSDHVVFRKLRRKTKFQIAYFHSARDSKFIHSVKDSPDKCSPEILNSCLEICYNALMKLDGTT